MSGYQQSSAKVAVFSRKTATFDGNSGETRIFGGSQKSSGPNVIVNAATDPISLQDNRLRSGWSYAFFPLLLSGSYLFPRRPIPTSINNPCSQQAGKLSKNDSVKA